MVQRTLDSFLFLDDDSVSRLDIVREETSNNGIKGSKSNITHHVRAKSAPKGNGELVCLGKKRSASTTVDDLKKRSLTFNIVNVSQNDYQAKRLKTFDDNHRETFRAINKIMSNPNHVEKLERVGGAPAEFANYAKKAYQQHQQMTQDEKRELSSTTFVEEVISDQEEEEEEETESPSSPPKNDTKLVHPTQACGEQVISPPKKKKNRRGIAMGDEKVMRRVDDEKISEYTSHGTAKLIERARQLVINTGCDCLMMITPSPKIKTQSRSKLVTLFVHGNVPMQIRRMQEALRYRLGKSKNTPPRWVAKCYTIYGGDKYMKCDEREPMAPYAPIQYTRKGNQGIVRVDYTNVRTTNQLHPRDVETMIMHFNNMIDALHKKALDASIYLERHQIVQMYKQSLGDSCMEIAPGVYMKNTMMIPLSKSVVEDLFENHRDEMNDVILKDMLTPPNDPQVLKSAAESTCKNSDIGEFMSDELMNITQNFFALIDEPSIHHNKDPDIGSVSSDNGSNDYGQVDGQNPITLDSCLFGSGPNNTHEPDISGDSDDSDDDDDDDDDNDHNNDSSEAIFLPGISKVSDLVLQSRGGELQDHDKDLFSSVIKTKDGSAFHIPEIDKKQSSVSDLFPMDISSFRNPETNEIDLDRLPPLPQKEMVQAFEKLKEIKINPHTLYKTIDGVEKTITGVHKIVEASKKIKEITKQKIEPFVMHQHTSHL